MVVYCPGYTPPKMTVLSSQINLGMRGRAGLLRVVTVQSIVQSDGTSAFVSKRGALAWGRGLGQLCWRPGRSRFVSSRVSCSEGGTNVSDMCSSPSSALNPRTCSCRTT